MKPPAQKSPQERLAARSAVLSERRARHGHELPHGSTPRPAFEIVPNEFQSPPPATEVPDVKA